MNMGASVASGLVPHWLTKISWRSLLVAISLRADNHPQLGGVLISNPIRCPARGMQSEHWWSSGH